MFAASARLFLHRTAAGTTEAPPSSATLAPVEFDPVLVERAREALAAAAILAEGKASSLAPHVKSGKPGTRQPAGDSTSLLDVIAGQFAAARDDEALRLAVFRAEAAIARIRRGPVARPGADPTSTGDDRSFAILTEWEGSPSGEVAAWEGVTIAHVRRLRWQNGREPETGEVVEGRKLTAWATPAERARRACDLKADNPTLSARAIAQLLGVSHVTVLADLRRAVEASDAA
jgi:hypothetical protein